MPHDCTVTQAHCGKGTANRHEYYVPLNGTGRGEKRRPSQRGKRQGGQAQPTQPIPSGVDQSGIATSDRRSMTSRKAREGHFEEPTRLPPTYHFLKPKSLARRSNILLYMRFQYRMTSLLSAHPQQKYQAVRTAGSS